jgi:single-strand DNA-binding protein
MTYHTMIIVGRLGKDPEMRYTPNGAAVTSFSVATDRQYNDSAGQKVKETIWFRIEAWGKQAETCNQYLKKGQMVLVEGRLRPDTKSGGPRIWNRQDGSPAASYEVVANTVRFLSSKSGGSGELADGASESEAGAGGGDEEIPF